MLDFFLNCTLILLLYREYLRSIDFNPDIQYIVQLLNGIVIPHQIYLRIISNMLPAKTKSVYEKSYDQFREWGDKKHIKQFSEYLLINHSFL